jgi:DNA-binding MarR family transcriptional regulator
MQQYNVLRILRGASEPLPTLVIAERMIEQAPGITRLIDRLEAKGLVARESCPTDRRKVHCRITTAGNELLSSLDPVLEDADNLLATQLAPEAIEQLLALLAAARDVFAADLEALGDASALPEATAARG